MVAKSFIALAPGLKVVCLILAPAEILGGKIPKNVLLSENSGLQHLLVEREAVRARRRERETEIWKGNNSSRAA